VDFNGFPPVGASGAGAATADFDAGASGILSSWSLYCIRLRASEPKGTPAIRV
jgi:hypothetical protein